MPTTISAHTTIGASDLQTRLKELQEQVQECGPGELINLHDSACQVIRDIHQEVGLRQQDAHDAARAVLFFQALSIAKHVAGYPFGYPLSARCAAQDLLAILRLLTLSRGSKERRMKRARNNAESVVQVRNVVRELKKSGKRSAEICLYMDRNKYAIPTHLSWAHLKLWCSAWKKRSGTVRTWISRQ